MLSNRKTSLKTIVLFWLGIFFAGMLIVFNSVFYFTLKYSFYDKLHSSLILTADSIKDNFLKGYRYKRRLDRVMIIPQSERYGIYPLISIVYNEKLKVIATTTFGLKLDKENMIFHKFPQSFFVVNSPKYGRVLVYTKRINTPLKGFILVATPLSNIESKLDDILLKMVLLTPLFLLLLLIGVNMILNRILNPIKEITRVANKISVGELNQTIPLPKHNDEIRELVTSFNSMVLRLQNGIEMMERFNSDVSHELKTPLTVLKGEIDIALRKERSVEHYKHILEIMLKEVNYLIELVNEMLFLTKLENEGRKKIELVQVDDSLFNVLSQLSKKAKEFGVKLNLVYLDSCEIETNSTLLQALFINLIDNAIKYTPKGGKIDVSLRCQDDRLIFIVEDDGIGIAEEEISKIMDRFYRTEESRNRDEVKGFGLGLSIVQKCLEILDGKISFESELNRGTKVEVELRSVKNVMKM